MSSKTASPPTTVSRSISAASAAIRAARTLLLKAIPKSARKRSFAPIRSVRACAGSGAPSESRQRPSLAGSKKVAALGELEETLVHTPADRVLELDELWSFVYRKSDKVWVWLALCRESRQVVAFVMGDRSRATCERLWRAIPESYKYSTCYSDFWEAYREVIPEDRHEATGKEEGETCHVERWINTLRQRLSRFVKRRSRSPSPIRCTTAASSCSSTATTWSEGASF